MRRTLAVPLLLLPLAINGCAGRAAPAEQWDDLGAKVAQQANGNAEEEAAAGLREALDVAATRTASALGRAGGYTNDPRLHIGIPEDLQPMAKTLHNKGFGQYVQSLENDMNIGAEIAAAKSGPILRQAIARMPVHDALIIVQGDDTAATRYFRGQVEGDLQVAFRPEIREGLRKTGYYDSYRTMVEKYNRIPLAEKPKLDLEQYVLDKAIDGLFLRMAEEERAIRHDPAKRTTALLKKTFGTPAP